MTDRSNERIALLAKTWAEMVKVPAEHLESLLRSRNLTDARQKMFQALDAFGTTEENAVVIVKYMRPRGLDNALASFKVESEWAERKKLDKVVGLITGYRTATNEYVADAILNELRTMTKAKSKQVREAIRVAIRADDHTRLNVLLGVNLPSVGLMEGW